MTSVPKGHVLLVFKSYFDGGNEPDNPEYSHASLASVSGTDRQWRRFNTEWKKVLHKHGAKFLHTTDAASLQNEFDVAHGWSKKSVDALILDCVSVIGKHIEIPSGPRNRLRGGLYPVTFTIPFADWLRARQNCSTLPNTVAEICATESLGFCLRRGRKLGASAYELYFDQGERFHSHALARSRNKQCRIDMPILEKIVHIGESDMRDVPALQMADLFAWCINHNHKVVRKWHSELHSLPWTAVYLNYEQLLSPNPRAIEMTHSWKLPRRESTESKIKRLSRKRSVVVPDIPDNLFTRRKG